MASSWTENLFVGAATLLAAVYVGVGVLVWLGMGNPGDYPRFVWAIVGLSAGAMIAAGLFAHKRSPLFGDVLVFVGAVPLALLFFWAVVPLLLVLLMVALRARGRWISGKAA